MNNLIAHPSSADPGLDLASGSLALVIIGGVAAWLMVEAANLPMRYLVWYGVAALLPSALMLLSFLVAATTLFSASPNWGALVAGLFVMMPIVSIARLAPFAMLVFIGLKYFVARGRAKGIGAR